MPCLWACGFIFLPSEVLEKHLGLVWQTRPRRRPLKHRGAIDFCVVRDLLNELSPRGQPE
jgi:hypothetical protein